MSINIGKLREGHDRFLAAHESMVAGAMYDASVGVLAEVALHPQFKPRTGALQKATQTRIVRTRSGRIVRVTNAKTYARSIEEGARPHTITAKNSKTLRFVSRNGGVVYRRTVHHPGNRAFWFLRKATDVGSERLGRLLTNGMQRISRIRF